MSSDGKELAGGTNPDGGLSNTAKRYLAGQTGRDYQCQIGVGCHTPFSAPWRGAQRESAKTQLFKYVRSQPEGIPLSRVVRDVFGQSAVNNADKDYQLARRFFESCSWFKTARRDGYLWVEPTLELFHLSRQYANRKTSGRRRGGLSNGADRRKTGCDDRADSPTVDDGGQSTSADGVGSPQYPKDRAQSVLSKRVVLDGGDGGHDYRDDLLRELGTEREVQQDKFKILRRQRGNGSDHLLLPYRTKFNAEDRAQGTTERFETALEKGADDYNSAVVATLTTAPGRFESLSAAVENLSEAKGRLLSWLATDYQLGHRPPNLSVLEFTESGLPHLHVVFFGVSWVTPQSRLSAKWDDYGQGRSVDVRTARRRGDRWLLHNDDGGTVTVRDYLGKVVRRLRDVASMDAGQLREAAEAGDIEYWRQALYWATGRQHVSCSPSLRGTGDDSDDLPHVAVYAFVGVAQYQSIPAHVRQSAVVLSRDSPPPD